MRVCLARGPKLRLVLDWVPAAAKRALCALPECAQGSGAGDMCSVRERAVSSCSMPLRVVGAHALGSAEVVVAGSSSLASAEAPTPLGAKPRPLLMFGAGRAAESRALVEAAGRGDVSEVNSLLLAGASASARHSADAKSMTALHAAVLGRSAECCRLLLDRGADVHAECLMLGSGLHTPSEQSGSCLEEPCGGVNCHDSVDYFCLWQPLHEAAARGLDSVCEMLLSAGARAGRGELRCHITPLHCAAVNGHVSTVRLLLAHGATVHACARSRLDSSLPMGEDDVFDGWQPLHFAVACCRHNTARVLLLCGADLAARASTARWSADAVELAEWVGAWDVEALRATAERASARRVLMLWRCSLQWRRRIV